MAGGGGVPTKALAVDEGLNRDRRFERLHRLAQPFDEVEAGEVPLALQPEAADSIQERVGDRTESDAAFTSLHPPCRSGRRKRDSAKAGGPDNDSGRDGTAPAEHPSTAEAATAPAQNSVSARASAASQMVKGDSAGSTDERSRTVWRDPTAKGQTASRPQGAPSPSREGRTALKYRRTTRRPRTTRHAEATGSRHRIKRRLLLAAVLPALCALGLPALRADTVYLKDGTQILDCQVTSETATHVSLKTPVGNMVVPRTEIFRIQKVKTAYDRYEEQLATVREGDPNGLFKLALWCRAQNGLRKESDDLLAKAIVLKEDHAEARRLLGYLKLGGEWVLPPPLAIRLKASGPNASDLRTNLDIFLKTRRDVVLAPVSDSRSDTGDPLDRCALDVSVTITRKGPTTFYGMSLASPTLAATVRFEAESPWIGKTPLRASATGLVPEKGGTVSLAVQNALGSSSAILHRFLDQMAQLRSKKIEEAFRKKELEADTAKK